jgi:hypothetical protein
VTNAIELSEKDGAVGALRSGRHHKKMVFAMPLALNSGLALQQALDARDKQIADLQKQVDALKKQTAAPEPPK